MNVEVEAVVEAVVRELKDRMMVEVEASGRHVHLCRDCLLYTSPSPRD